MQILTPPEIRRLLDGRGELLGLRWEGIDLEAIASSPAASYQADASRDPSEHACRRLPGGRVAWYPKNAPRRQLAVTMLTRAETAANAL